MLTTNKNQGAIIFYLKNEMKGSYLNMHGHVADDGGQGTQQTCG